MMKKTVCFLLACLFVFSACGVADKEAERTLAEQCAKTGWGSVGRYAVSPTSVYVMKYTSVYKLCDKVPETALRDDLPGSGYAVLYYNNLNGFDDCYACFFESDGDFSFSFDYNKTYAEYEKYFEMTTESLDATAADRALEAISDCNYISGMILYARRDLRDLTKTTAEDLWYVLSDKQMEWVLK